MHRRVIRAGKVVVALVLCPAMIALAGLAQLTYEYLGTPSASARSAGTDSLWLGHAWVDGRKTQSDVDDLAVKLRGTGIRNLFVHAGPFNHDGSLNRVDPWFVKAAHSAMPGVRVQAWLGAHPLPSEIQLGSAETRARALAAVGQVLDEGFDGIHYDFEPVDDGNDELVTMLRETRPLTRRRGAVLSVSAAHLEPWPLAAACVTAAPGRLMLWSGNYLRRVAMEVDQVAVMSYDTALPTAAAYGGYVRRTTETALAVVPADVTLFIGVPAYHDKRLTRHDRAETVAASLRGIRLALGDKPPGRVFGVALYVDFAATPEDWSSYERWWMQANTE